MNKKQLLELWQEYKQVRQRIELPVNPNEERTIISFLNWVATTPNNLTKGSV